MKEKNLKSIDLVFENCEYASIPIDQIEYFGMESYNVYGSYTSNNGFRKDTSIKNMRIIFKNLETLMHKDLGSKQFDRFTIDRLHYPDITHIDLIYEDGTNEYLGVAWGGNYLIGQAWNAFQVLGKNKWGEYYLELEEGWTFKKRYNYMKYCLLSYKYHIKRKIKYLFYVKLLRKNRYDY